MRARHVSLLMLVVAFLSASAGAWAQGYGIYEQSACAMGRGGAGVAAPCPDGSAIYFNPAGIVQTPGQVFRIGASVIGPRGDFTVATPGQVSNLKARYFPVPNIFYKDTFAG